MYKDVSKCWGEYNFVNCFESAIILNGLDTEDGQMILVQLTHKLT